MNNNDVHGSIMCLGPLCTTWNVTRLEDVTSDSLALLDIVKPAPGWPRSRLVPGMPASGGALST